jgi:glycerol-3-phosphate acyltransferase PlsY
VASISAGFSFPIWVILAYRDTSLSLAIFSVLAALLLVYTHRKNISRLLQGTEGKASFLFRKQ